MEILDGMPKGATLVLNGDDEYLKNQKPEGYNVIYYGIENDKCDVNAVINPDATVTILGQTIKMPVPGKHNISNAAAAMAVASALGISLPHAAREIEKYVPDGIRQTISETAGGVKIMSDYYNASPQSVKAALEVLKSTPATRKIAVLGDMLELGTYSKGAHIEVGNAAGNAADCVITVGNEARFIAEGATKSENNSVYTFKDNAGASAFLKTFMQEGDMILIKGSRGMRMEEIYNEIYNFGGEAK